MKKEFRYVVIKVKDAKQYLTEDDLTALARINSRIDNARRKDNKPLLNCVVVEHDWPEYEPTWEAIAKRVDHDT